MRKSSEARIRAQTKYNRKPEQVKKRVNRNKARRQMIAAGKAKVGDGKDVAHLDNNTAHNNMVNLMLQSKAKNRSFKRNSKAQRA